MRGTCAVIAVVLLVVLAAHVQREANRHDDEGPAPAMAYQSSGGCESASDDSAAFAAVNNVNDAPSH